MGRSGALDDIVKRRFANVWGDDASLHARKVDKRSEHAAHRLHGALHLAEDITGLVALDAPPKRAEIKRQRVQRLAHVVAGDGEKA